MHYKDVIWLYNASHFSIHIYIAILLHELLPAFYF